MLQKELSMDLIRGAMTGSRAYHFSHIIDITREGVAYYDEALRRRFIRFEDCVNNWSAYAENSPKIDLLKLKATETRVVGNRFLNRQMSFFEFFSDPVIRFEFPYRKRFFSNRSEIIKSFHQIEQQIVKAGYTTYNIG